MYPYNLSETFYYYPSIGLCAVHVPEADSLYGVAMAGFFSTKDMDSLHVLMGVCKRVYGQFVLLDTADFTKHYRVKLFEHYEIDTAGKYIYSYPYLYEFYFDRPVSIADVDTLFVGVYGFNIYRTVPPPPVPPYIQYPFVVAQGWDNTGTNNGKFWRFLDGEWEESGFMGWYGYFPIVAPDEVRCPRPAAPWLAAVDGHSATLQWDPCLCDSLQLELTLLDSLGIPAAPARTHIPQTDSLLTLHDLDTSRCYAARLRVQCHHQCPSHDTTLWSPWSDTLRFCLGTGGIDGLAAPAAPGLMPNPTDGPLTVETDGRATAIAVHDMAGRLVGGWRVEALDDTRATLDVAPLRPGAYLLTVQTASGSRTARFVRR